SSRWCPRLALAPGAKTRSRTDRETQRADDGFAVQRQYHDANQGPRRGPPDHSRRQLQRPHRRHRPGTRAGQPVHSAQGPAAGPASPKPCPLIGMGAPGDPSLPDLGDIDIRTDVPRYRVFKDGELIDDPTDIRTYWRPDLVSFVLGCSFSFELPILEAGIRLRHIEDDRTVAMYRTNIACVPAGRFRGNMVVSMRPFTPADAIRVIQITSRFPAVHGAPVHMGLPEAIGIRDLARPDYGDPPDIAAGELPLFWACGVTPQVAIEAARPSLSITHKPGAMLITNKRNNQLAA